MDLVEQIRPGADGLVPPGPQPHRRRTRGRAGQIQRRYAELTGLPVEPVTGGTYTGTATQWEAAKVPKGVAFIVELGPTLDGAGAATHADAVLTLAYG